MLQTLIISIAALIVTLGILVTFHEFGHYWVARRCGVKVLRFSIGFGKPLKTWVDREGTEFVIAPIPLGGYVKMLGQEDTTVTDPRDVPAEERKQSFACKALWQRMAIVAAGPFANFLLAIVVFWLINVIYGVTGVAPVISSVVDESPAYQAGLRRGDEIVAVDDVETTIWQQVTMQLLSRLGESGELKLSAIPAGGTEPREYSIPLQNWQSRSTAPDPLGSLGLVQYEIPAVIESVVPESRAEQSGLQSGDLIVSADGVSVEGWRHWVRIVQASPELDLDVVVQREGSERELTIRPARTPVGDANGVVALSNAQVIGTIGAAVQQPDILGNLPPEMRRDVNYNVFSAVAPAIAETWEKSIFVLESMKKMVVGLISVKNINGPITIAQVAGETASYGVEVYLGFLAILSISLGVLNLLPIPVLDGGHLLYYAIEAIIRRPVPERIQAVGLQLGLLLIAGIMILAVYNDVTRLL